MRPSRVTDSINLRIVTKSFKEIDLDHQGTIDQFIARIIRSVSSILGEIVRRNAVDSRSRDSPSARCQPTNRSRRCAVVPESGDQLAQRRGIAWLLPERARNVVPARSTKQPQECERTENAATNVTNGRQ